ncbi:phage head-tail joining protein [Pannonibacter indicus]|uniref:phage head-tail joining protein n=1 Tax=Pannonibacter indicus TaxID=466044 RepID=UPI003919D42B
MTLAELQTQAERLRALRGRGVRKVSIDGEEVEYRSDAELAAAIADIEARIAALVKPRSRIFSPKVSKGY